MSDKLEITPNTYSSGPVWNWFGLTRSSYLVLPRSLMCGMPLEWQKKFVALLDEMEEVYDTGTMVSNYSVSARGIAGKFIRDPYSNYRHPGELPYK